MRTASLSLAAALLLAAVPDARATDDLLATPGSQASAGKHCFGDARPKWLAATTLVGQVNPLGVELQLQAGRCLPLITSPGELFDYTNFQYGLAAYVSPVYAMPGAFVSIAPLSVLELRAEAEYVQEWTIGLDASGYFPLTGYDAPLKTLPAASARAAQRLHRQLHRQPPGRVPAGGAVEPADRRLGLLPALAARRRRLLLQRALRPRHGAPRLDPQGTPRWCSRTTTSRIASRSGSASPTTSRG